jgi:sporulation protein YlmC with PRC-barrel domain
MYNCAFTMQSKTIATMIFATALAAAPAFAQSTTNTMGNNSAGSTTHPSTSTGTAPGMVGAGSSATSSPGMAATNSASRTDSGNNKPSDVNPVMTDNGDVRASKVIGSSVYNDKNEKIGSIDDILIGKDNQPTEAVLSVGGFLGLGSKLVAVPYNKLQFGNTKNNSDNRVMMPGATKDTVGAMADYHYTANG